MDLSLNMATLPRHGHLTSSFFADVKDLFKKGLLYPLQEQHYLAYLGKKYSGEERLIEPTYFSRYTDTLFEELGRVQPDFLFFKDNKYIQNKTTMITLGIPDLVVEVWSDSNDDIERMFKQRIYSSSDKCEHWYLEQNSNLVKCYLGKKQLKDQTLLDFLVTTKGIKFDLRYLALK